MVPFFQGKARGTSNRIVPPKEHGLLGQSVLHTRRMVPVGGQH